MFIFKQINKQSIDLCVRKFISGSISKEKFIEKYNLCVQDYNLLFIDSNEVKDDDMKLIYGVITAPLLKY